MRLKNGWYEVHWPHGEGSDVAQVYSRYDGQYAQLSRYNAQKVELYLAQGYKFVPVIALTPGRVAALREAVFELQVSVDAQWSWKDIQPTINTLRAMLSDAAQEGGDSEVR